MTNILADIRRHSYDRPKLQDLIAVTPSLATAKKSLVGERQMISFRLLKSDMIDGRNGESARHKERIQLPKLTRRSISTISKADEDQKEKRLSPRKRAALLVKHTMATQESNKKINLEIQHARNKINRIIQRKKLRERPFENDEQRTIRQRYNVPHLPSVIGNTQSLNWLEGDISQIEVVETEPADPQQIRQFLD